MINSEYIKTNVAEHGIMIVPTLQKDPILNLGKNPILCGITDASDNIDQYLYGKRR